LIAHRLTAPADQDPVVKWLKANTSKDVLDQVAGSLASLKTGEGWICAGEAHRFERVQFPRIHTYDNTATPTGEGETREIKTAPVDQDKLRAIIGDAVEQAKADDPRELRKQIAELKKQVAQPPPQPNPKNEPIRQPKPVLTDADRALLEKVHAKIAEVQRLLTVNTSFDITDIVATFEKQLARFKQDLWNEQSDARDAFLAVLDGKGFQKILDKLATVQPDVRLSATTRQTDRQPLVGQAPRAVSRPARQLVAGLDGAQQKILDVVAMLIVRGIDVNRESVAGWLDIHPNGGRYGSNLAYLRAEGYLDGFTLTEKGASAAAAMDTGLVAARDPLDGAQRQILDTLEQADGQRFTRETLAAALGIHPNGGRYGSNLARLRTMGLIPDRGEIHLTEGARR
jgi:hypothetical protein